MNSNGYSGFDVTGTTGTAVPETDKEECFPRFYLNVIALPLLSRIVPDSLLYPTS